jgi:hypothetical protein
MDLGKLSDLNDTFCDNVRIGQIGVDQYGRYIGIGLNGQTVVVNHDRPVTYRTLRKRAYEDGLLVRVRKGIYRASKS